MDAPDQPFRGSTSYFTAREMETGLTWCTRGRHSPLPLPLPLSASILTDVPLFKDSSIVHFTTRKMRATESVNDTTVRQLALWLRTSRLVLSL